MTDAPLFDRWADSYDQDVAESDQRAAFPFAGYAKVLNCIAKLVFTRKPGELLDLGTGSGTLAVRFYKAGWKVTAVDFSDEMLRQARERMPQATLLVADFAEGIPAELAGKAFDFIVMTYAFHHLPYERQADFLRLLMPYLNENGKVLIGDVAFENQSSLIACQKRCSGEWDEGEFYPILAEIQTQLPELQVAFEVISFCAGVIQVSAGTSN